VICGWTLSFAVLSGTNNIVCVEIGIVLLIEMFLQCSFQLSNSRHIYFPLRILCPSDWWTLEDWSIWFCMLDVMLCMISWILLLVVSPRDLLLHLCWLIEMMQFFLWGFCLFCLTQIFVLIEPLLFMLGILQQCLNAGWLIMLLCSISAWNISLKFACLLSVVFVD